MRTYLAVTPDKLTAALKCTEWVAHVAYRIGEDGALMRSALPSRVRGGIMVLGDEGCGRLDDIRALCAEVWKECEVRGFGGVLADFEKPPEPDRVEFLKALGDLLRRSGRGMFVPESYGAEVRQAAVLICTAISGGTLRQRLEEAKSCYGNRLALDLQRLRMEFPLPCPNGEGCALDQETLCDLLRAERSVFFDEDLCAKYFTRECECGLRMILFDDAETLRGKLRLAQRLGIGSAFLMYPEVEDLLPELYRQC